MMDYFRLTKPRSVALLLFTAFAAMVMAQPDLPSLDHFLWTLLGGAFAAAGANTLNSYLDRDLDRRMERTARRPLPSGKLPPGRALAFGLLLCLLSLLLLGLGVNELTAALAAGGVFYYVVVYTWWLKRKSLWNVVIGGGAGAIPLLVGWAAASGRLSLWALWLGVIVVFWTPPHFWSLALLRRREYASAGVPMWPVVRGERSTHWQILGYVLALLLISLSLFPVGFAGPSFFAVALFLGILLVVRAVQLLREANDRAAWRLYRYSIVYLSLLFGSMILDRVGGFIVSSGSS